MGSFRTHYDNLQVTENASIDVIKGAYKFLSQKWHPDKHPDNRSGAEQIMRIINDAYDVLSDSEKRKAHDRWIAETRQRQAEEARATEQSRRNQEKTSKAASASEFTDDPEADVTQWKVLNAIEEEGEHSLLISALCRFIARLVDLYIFVLLLEAITSIWPGGSSSLRELLDNRVTMSIVAVILWVPIEALFLYAFGGTPGKWLMGIDVRKRQGGSLTISDSLQRSLGVAVLGMGGGIPGLYLVTNFLAFRKFLNTDTTIWDMSLRLKLTYRKWTPLHLTTSLVMVVSAIVAFVISLPEPKDSEAYFEPAVHKVSSQINSDLPALEVSNECPYSVKLAISYVDLEGQQQTEGWWYVNPESSLKFTGGANQYLTTNDSEWYFFASIVNGPEYSWKGQYKYQLFDSVLPMKKVEAKEGSRVWSINCPDSLKAAKEVTPVRNSVKKKTRTVRDENSCVIKGVMTNEELARCRR